MGKLVWIRRRRPARWTAGRAERTPQLGRQEPFDYAGTTNSDHCGRRNDEFGPFRTPGRRIRTISDAGTTFLSSRDAAAEGLGTFLEALGSLLGPLWDALGALGGQFRGVRGVVFGSDFGRAKIGCVS